MPWEVNASPVAVSAGTRERSGFEEEVNYLINIIENIGSDLTRQCYWDFGRWSDLWRVWRQPGDDRLAGDGTDFEACPVESPLILTSHQFLRLSVKGPQRCYHYCRTP